MAPWRSVCVVVAAASTMMSAYLLNVSLQSYGSGETAQSVLLGFSCIGMLWTAGVCTDMFLLHPAKSHTFKTLLLQYLFLRGVYFAGKLCWFFVKRWPTKCESLQEQTLKNILHQSRNTVYGKRYNFSAIKSPHEFIQQHPLTKYNHFEEYIHMMSEENHENVLFTGKVSCFAMSSGTTGKSKMLPFNEFSASFNKAIFVAIFALYYRFMQDLNFLSLQRMFYLRCMSPTFKTKSGHRLTMIGTLIHRHLPFFNTPKAMTKILSLNESLHVHAVFALAEREVAISDFYMANLAYDFVRYIEDNWPEICKGIEHGRLSPSVKIDDDVRSEINKCLKPDPARAKELRQEFEHGFDNIFERVWPNCKGIYVISTGTFAMYLRLLKKYLGNIPTYNSMYGSTEGLYGFCYNQDGRYIISPTTNFYEFIPSGFYDDARPNTLMCHQVEIGKEYELVVTTYSGLYRFRMGDVIRVVDKLNGKLPVVEFSFRSGQMLDIAFEKTPENIFYKAIDQTNSEWGDVLLDYTTTESAVLEEIVGHSVGRRYIVFVETSKHLSDEQKSMLDSRLCSIFEYYQLRRSTGAIESMKVVQVKKGCFARLKAAMIKKTQSAQFKIPRVLRKEEYLKMLLQEIVDTENI